MPIRWGTNTLYAGSVLLGKGLIAIKRIYLLLGFNLGMFLTNPKSKSKSKSGLTTGFSLKSDFPTTQPAGKV